MCSSDLNFGLKYSANGRYCGTEVLITKPDLILPLDILATRAALPELALLRKQQKLASNEAAQVVAVSS